MSETPTDRQSGINEDASKQAGSADGNPRMPGGRTLRAGSEFLKAVASDLAALASWLRLWLVAKYQLLKIAVGDLAARASWIRPWLIAKHQHVKAVVSNLAAGAPGGRSIRAGGE
jgi:hypothetical protein